MTNDGNFAPNPSGSLDAHHTTADAEAHVGTVSEPSAAEQVGPTTHERIMAPAREDVDGLPNVIDGSTIEGREGDFVFTVGNVSSGKSTLQSFLIHRLWTDPRIIFEHASIDGDKDSDAYLHGWVRNVANGLFPRRTGAGNIREFRIRFGQTKRPKLSLNFIEIAGEDINSIVPSVTSTKRELNPYLERYLREPSISKRFLFVSDASANSDKGTSGQQKLQEDILFSALINHLISQEGIGLRRVSILFVVSKWDQVKKDYNSVQHYFRSHFPQTLALTTRSSRVDANYMPFSVGEVSVGRSAKDNSDVPLIMRKDNRYIDQLISWLYESFVGDQLGGYPQLRPSALQRFKNFVARLI